MGKNLFIFITCLQFLLSSEAFAEKTETLILTDLRPVDGIVKALVRGTTIQSDIWSERSSNPHFFEPNAKDLERLSLAHTLILLHWGGGTKQLARVKSASKKTRVLDLREHNHDHSHGDPHLWNAPAGLVRISKKIADYLIQTHPRFKDRISRNAQNFAKSAEGLSKKWSMKFLGVPEQKRVFLVYHPAWGDFAEEFGLEMISVEQEGKVRPPKRLAELESKIKKLKLKTIFVRRAMNSPSATSLAKRMRLKKVELDPLPPEPLEGIEVTAQKIWESFLE